MMLNTSVLATITKRILLQMTGRKQERSLQ